MRRGAPAPTMAPVPAPAPPEPEGARMSDEQLEELGPIDYVVLEWSAAASRARPPR